MFRKCKLQGWLWMLVGMMAGLTGCQTFPQSGTAAPRRGDEIVAAGQFFHTGTKVVLWMDPGGYDAYRVERRFSPFERAGWESSKAEVKTLTTPNRYGIRAANLSSNQLERVRGGGWDLPALQEVVDQFVLHYDACGSSRQCFKILQDERGLSVHFLLDVDGTIYQTLDLKERAWHASSSNSRSVGVEIANLGAVAPEQTNRFAGWYAPDGSGGTALRVPARLAEPSLSSRLWHPMRPRLVGGSVQGQFLVQYDFTPEQYRALIRLTAALCRVFPRIQCDCPRDAQGRVLDHKLAEADLKQFEGVLGHYHIQTDKVDPGPAFQWDYVLQAARQIGRQPSVRNFEAQHHGALLLRNAPETENAP